MHNRDRRGCSVLSCTEAGHLLSAGNGLLTEMSAPGARLGHRQWSGCERWQGTQASTRLIDIGSSRLLAPRLNNQCTFLGAALKRPNDPAHLPGCKSGGFGVSLGPVAICRLARSHFVRGTHKCSLGTPRAVAFVGATTEEERLQEHRPFEVAAASGSALVQKVEATPGMSAAYIVKVGVLGPLSGAWLIDC
jgi:hypothetical protein